MKKKKVIITKAQADALIERVQFTSRRLSKTEIKKLKGYHRTLTWPDDWSDITTIEYILEEYGVFLK